MKKELLLLLSLLPFSVIAQPPKRLYLGNDTHVDLMYNGTEEKWSQLILDMADFYLKLGENTKNEKPALQSKWNYDVAYWLWVLEHNTSPEYFNRIIAQIKNQQASVPYNFTLPIYGASSAESVLRSFYYSGYLQRKYGIDVDIAVCQENATIPLGLASLWAGSGAKYSWKGVCNCATKTPTKGTRPHEIYYYTGLDSSKILMKWYSNYGWNAELGGYAEMLEPTVAVIQMDTLCNSKRYPYRIAGAFGKGWDNMVNYAYDIQWGVNHRTRPGTEVIISNELDFFRDFEKNYGNQLPSQTLAYGNEWDLLPASLAAVSGSVKRSMEKLRTAEAMAAVIHSTDSLAFEPLKKLKEDFLYGISVYSVHGWTVDGPVQRHQFATWARQQQQKIARYVDTLYDLSQKKLGEKISTLQNKERFFVFNPLNWERNDIADIAYDTNITFSIIDLSTNKIVPFQKITKNGKNYVRIWATGVPSVGYKVYEIQKTNAPSPVSPFSFTNNILETPYYQIAITSDGVISSLLDKKTKRQLVKSQNGKYLNDLGGIKNNKGTITVENSGSLSCTVRCESKDPLHHVSYITVYSKSPRVDIKNEIRQNFSEPQHWSFSFDIDSSSIWHEEVGAVIKAKLQSQGGHYSDHMARYDYQSLNHFADISNAEGGVTISNTDCLFMKVGNSTPEKLDGASAQVNILAGGQIDKDKNLGIFDQDGDSVFYQHFSLTPYTASYRQTRSMKWALEHQSPLTTGFISKKGNMPAKQYSFLSISNPNILLWALKPGEEGGAVFRVWNMENESFNSGIKFQHAVKEFREITHVETPLQKINPVQNKYYIKLRQQQMASYRIEFNFNGQPRY